MAQSLQTKIRGLYTFPNDLSAVPEGSLSKADNIVIDRDSIAEPRKGMTYLGTTTARADLAASEQFERIFFFQGTIIGLTYNNSTGFRYLKYFDSTLGWIHCSGAIGTNLKITPFYLNYPKVRSHQERNNLYLTTGDGVLKVDAYQNIPKYMGVPEALPLIPTSLLPTDPWLAVNDSVTYRVTWARKDFNGNWVEGAPSSAVIVKNIAAVPSSVTIQVNYPTLSAVGDVLRLYRSKSYTTGTSDELLQCYEEQIVSGTSTTVTDIVEDSLLSGTALYTNESQQTLYLANYMPPLAKDICSYRDCTFLANIQEYSTYTLQITKTDGGANLGAVVAGDTITIGTIGADLVTYTAVTEITSPGALQFRVYVSGTPSEDSANTSKDLVRSINAYNQLIPTGIWATYEPNITSNLLGSIIIKRISFASAIDFFYVNSSKKLAWIPPLLPVGQADNNSKSSYDVLPNYVAYSKPQEPESFPLSYRFPVGSSDNAILRILPLRDSLFILKESGVYRLYGTDPSNFQVALMDATVNVIAPDSVIVLNNQIFALTTQGVVTINENGVTIISRPIESDLLDLLNINPTKLKTESFAVGYESQRAYYLWVPTNENDVYPTQYYRYNVITNNWTRGTLSAKIAGGVNPADNLLYLSTYAQPWMDVERSSFTNFDYADYVSTNAITAQSAKTITIAGASSLVVGQTILQDDVYSSFYVAMGVAGGFDETTNRITQSNHGYHTGMKVRISITAGALPAGLSSGYYYVIRIAGGLFQLATTHALALAGTAVDFTDNGTTGQSCLFTPDNNEKWATITAIGTTTVTVDYAVPFRITNAIVSAPIATNMKYNPNSFQNPGINKQIREVALMFLSDFYGSGQVSFYTDISQGTSYEAVSGSVAGPWGQFPWGQATWGGIIRRRPMRVGVPRNHQRCSFIVVGFQHAVCFSPWAIQGISMVGNNISERIGNEGGGGV
jgi:hypothetical protein